MTLAIPLEDHFFDIIAKAQRGLGFSDEALSNRAGISLTTLEELKKGHVDSVALSKVAAALALGGESLQALAQSRYTPEEVPDFEGLAHFNSVFYDMTVNAFVVGIPRRERLLFLTLARMGTRCWSSPHLEASELQKFLSRTLIQTTFSTSTVCWKRQRHRLGFPKENLCEEPRVLHPVATSRLALSRLKPVLRVAMRLAG